MSLFFKNYPSMDTCFVVLQLFGIARTSMSVSQPTEQNANVLYPEMNAQL